MVSSIRQRLTHSFLGGGSGVSNILVILPRLIQLELMEANQTESQPILTWLLLTVSALHHERHGDGSHGDGHQRVT